jgi:hypothetical protein
MTNIRRWHSYIGLFIAPSVLFFSLTGAVQLFSLHEAHDKYQPRDSDAQQPARADDDDKSDLSTLMLKGFFLLVALCLALSTSFGLWMGLTHTNRKAIGWLLVAAGSLIPVTLLLF